MAQGNISKLISSTVGWSINASNDLHQQDGGETFVMVVDSNPQSQKILAYYASPTGNSHVGCQLGRMGSILSGPSGSGELAISVTGIVLNILELRAAFHNFLAFTLSLRGKSFLLGMDNKIEVAYIQRQGGTRSRTLLKKMQSFFQLGSGSSRRSESHICSSSTEPIS